MSDIYGHTTGSLEKVFRENNDRLYKHSKGNHKIYVIPFYRAVEAVEEEMWNKIKDNCIVILPKHQA